MWRQEDRHKQWLGRRNRRWMEYSGWCLWSFGWGGRIGTGKWWKRALHKARRRAAKAEITGRHVRGLAGYESTVNWRAT